MGTRLSDGTASAAGPKGARGLTGPANILSIGTVTTDETPSATITGTTPNQVLNLVLAQGPKGDNGISLHLLGTKDLISQLPSTGNIENDAYTVLEDGGHVYIWDDTNNIWIDGGQMLGPKGETGNTGPQGNPGLDGKTILSGYGAPNNNIGTVGDFYLRTSNSTLYGPKTSYNYGNHDEEYNNSVWGSGVSLKGATGAKGDTGNTGATGAKGNTGDAGTNGTNGITPAPTWTIISSGSQSDPTSGKFKFNSSSTGSLTSMYIDPIDADGINHGSWIDSWDTSTSTIKGYIVIENATTGSLVLRVNSTTSQSSGAYYLVSVTYLSGTIPATNSLNTMSFSRTGDKGDTGATGAKGDTGATGATGPAGTSASDTLHTFKTSAPTSTTSSGTKGEWAQDSSYLYVCIATNSWKRVAWGTWSTGGGG